MTKFLIYLATLYITSYTIDLFAYQLQIIDYVKIKITLQF